MSLPFEFTYLDVDCASDKVIMEGDGSPLSSLCMVRAAELFPRPEPEKEDDTLKVPFTELAGEFVRYIGRTDDGILAISNYRICIKSQTATAPETEISIPLNVIEYVTVRDLFQLVVSCKDASTFKCSFPTSEQCSEWQRRITLFIGVPTSLESLFAFSYYAWASEMQPNLDNEWIGRMQRATNYDDDFRKEVKRLDFNMSTTWRISTANVDFKLCPSYPRLILVPACITDETLHNVATFRSARRIPAVVWRHKASGAVIGRCSQPEVGWLGWRNPKDEQLLKAIADACSFDGGEMGRRQLFAQNASASENSSTDGSHEEVCFEEVKKILIVDARSYASAVTNRARGGGCECPEYYPCASIEFMNLGNIHVIRKSFHALRSLAASPADSQSWFTALDRTMWLTHLAGMMQSAMRICHIIEREGRSVIVHCSDGWDRTPQLVSTALLCLDPYYRTVEGFRILVEREWLSFGHKFADRIGHGPGSDETNERCPVFLQWLDCVHQIQKQFPCSFEFSMAYLIKLAQHVFSCMFGTFMCNNYKERIDNSVFDRSYSVWPFLSGPMYRNPLYIANRDQVLWPAYHPSNLSFWSEVYGSSFGNQKQSDGGSMTTSISATTPIVASAQGIGTTIVTPSTNDISNSEPRSPMIKTRSYGDIQTAVYNGISGGMGMIRRSSDPNMSVDAHFNVTISSEASIETLPEHYANGIDIDMNVINDQTIANFCSDTVRELNNLTEELQQTNLDNDIDFRINGDRQPNGHHSQIPNHKVEMSIDPNECIQNGDNDTDHNFDHMYGRSTPNYNYNDNLKKKSPDREIDSGNYIGDVVDSSPFYTQLNQCLENATNGEIKRQVSLENHRQGFGYENGVGIKDGNYVSNGDGDDNNGEASMMQSIDLRDTTLSLSSSPNIQSQWHGNIETSTDTLVPVVDTTTQQNNFDCAEHKTTNGNGYENHDRTSYNMFYRPKVNPEVYSHFKRPHVNNTTTNPMDESIFIQPEQSCMDITNGHRHDSVVTVPNANINHSSLYRRRKSSLNSKHLPTYAEVVCNNQSTTPRSDSISPIPINSKFSLTNPNRPASMQKPTSIRPTLNTQTSVTNYSVISCPDGLAHTLSEQNLRLQQIVHEHKIREEALQKELQALRLALLRKRTCSGCSNGQGSNTATNVVDETNSLIDNGIENVSICSWEAVDERNGAATIKNSTNALNASSVLWVPDHAVSRCTSCHTEFWLGRRKHHCRSCGNIYCADCSEFFAPLPDENLYTPVRLCGPCYHSVTTKSYEQNSSSIHASMSSSNHVRNLNSRFHSNPSTATSNGKTLEPCKNSMVTSESDQGPTKATTVMN